MWRVTFVGLVIACGGASEVRTVESTPALAVPHAPSAERPSGDTEHANASLASTLGSASHDPHDPHVPLGGPRDAIRDPRDAIRGRDTARDPRHALAATLSEEAPTVRCADAARCPPSVGLVVFPGREPDALGRVLPTRCTGTLVAPDRVLTASHCVTTPTCVGAWITFPATASHPTGFAHCAWVLARDPDDADAVLLEDWAILQLDRPLDRPFATLERAPATPGTIVTVASVTPHPIYDSRHELDGRLCRVESPEAAEARLGEGARRVGWLSGCPIEPGNSGSPVLDAEGRLRALVHAGSHPVFGIGVTTALPSTALAAP